MTPEPDQDEALFGGDAPAPIRELIHQAKHSSSDLAVQLLAKACADQPECLPPYYLLYKLLARRGELDYADRVACAALGEAGRLAGLARDWRSPDATLPARADFAANGPARFWLFTLKALAFLSLRRRRRDDAERILMVIATHDPAHSVGSAVTAALLAGLAP